MSRNVSFAALLTRAVLWAKDRPSLADAEKAAAILKQPVSFVQRAIVKKAMPVGNETPTPHSAGPQPGPGSVPGAGTGGFHPAVETLKGYANDPILGPHVQSLLSGISGVPAGGTPSHDPTHGMSPDQMQQHHALGLQERSDTLKAKQQAAHAAAQPGGTWADTLKRTFSKGGDPARGLGMGRVAGGAALGMALPGLASGVQGFVQRMFGGPGMRDSDAAYMDYVRQIGAQNASYRNQQRALHEAYSY